MDRTVAQHVVDYARNPHAGFLRDGQYGASRKRSGQDSYQLLREWLTRAGYRYLHYNAHGAYHRPSLYHPTNDRMRVEFSATRIRFQSKRGNDWQNRGTQSLISAAQAVLLDAQATLLRLENAEQIEAVLHALPLAYREKMIVRLDLLEKRDKANAPIAGFEPGRWWGR